MAVAQGYGKTVTSGSVFAYDVADTRNSYIGEPTANIFPDPKIVNGTSGWGISNATGGTTTVDTGRDGGQSIKVTVASGGDQYQYRGYGYGANKGGSTFTYSAYIKTSGISGTGVGMRTYWFDINGSWIWSNNNTSTIITGTQDWTRVTATSTAPTGTYSVIAIFYPVDKNGVGTYWITDIQIEEKSHVSQFINGTRPATQGLLPIVGNSTIDLSNMSFDSNAQMTFDGTNDYISITNTPTIVPTSNTSWEFILKLTSTSGYRALFQKSNYSNSTGFIALFMNPGSLTFRINASDVAESTRALDHYFSGNITLNVYTHVVLTYNGVVFTLYINGVPTDTVAWSYGLGTNQGDMYVGNFWAGYWPGEIPITKQYNITLSAAEVRQNYLHYKTRFNLS
jgi:hypothetical protein